MMVSLSSQLLSVRLWFLSFVDFDWKTFEQECRKIVNDINDRFLDLGLDEPNHSDFG
jgi:hypothetical protein